MKIVKLGSHCIFFFHFTLFIVLIFSLSIGHGLLLCILKDGSDGVCVYGYWIALSSLS